MTTKKNQNKKKYESTIDALLKTNSPTAASVAKALEAKKAQDEEKEAKEIIRVLTHFDERIDAHVNEIRRINAILKRNRKALKEILKEKDNYIESLESKKK